MILYIENESNLSLPFDMEQAAIPVIEKVLETEKCPLDVSVNLYLVDNDEIHRINLETRGIDRPTDVLSFPNLEYDTPGDFTFTKEELLDSTDPETGKIAFGEIIISIPKVIEQAKEYGHSNKREFCFLVAHSMLHLCGYDHMEDEEAKVMEEKQEAVLNSLGITREEGDQ